MSIQCVRFFLRVYPISLTTNKVRDLKSNFRVFKAEDIKCISGKFLWIHTANRSHYRKLLKSSSRELRTIFHKSDWSEPLQWDIEAIEKIWFSIYIQCLISIFLSNHIRKEDYTGLCLKVLILLLMVLHIFLLNQIIYTYSQSITSISMIIIIFFTPYLRKYKSFEIVKSQNIFN